MTPISNFSNLPGLNGIGGPNSIAHPSPAHGAAGAGGADFAEMLKQRIDEVSRLQQDADTAVENVLTGRGDDVSGVMIAVEKHDLAFKTLLAIRSKLMEAYDEVKNMQV